VLGRGAKGEVQLIRHDALPLHSTSWRINETIKQAVMAGLGLSLIFAHTIASEVADGRLAVLSVEGLPIVRQWFVLRRSDRELPRAGSSFVAVYRKKEK
jgi:DNA-binding transcriptional LysR family regulator